MSTFRAVVLFGLLTSVTAVFPAGAQTKDGFKESPFGFNPGQKEPILSQLVEKAKFHSVVVYARQPDDSTYGLVRAMDAKAAGLKRCPMYFVALFADPDALSEKTAKVETVDGTVTRHR